MSNCVVYNRSVLRSASILLLLLAFSAGSQAQDSQDWSGWQLTKALPDAEKERVRKKIADPIAATGVPELAALAKRITVKAMDETPIYKVVIETLVEERRLDRTKQPYEGPSVPPRSVDTADPWAPPLPKYDEFKGQSWRQPVKGSQHVETCKPCGGKGSMLCKECSGKGFSPCPPCTGTGNIPHPHCKGLGVFQCTSSKCYDLAFRIATDGLTCNWCKAALPKCGDCRMGKLLCPTCAGVKTQRCGSCSMQGKFACSVCAGKGRTLESLDIVIGLVMSRAEPSYTLLDPAWLAHVTIPEKGWMTVALPDLDTAAAKMTDAALRGFVLKKADMERAGKKNVRGQHVSVLRVPVVTIQYDCDGTTYDMAEIGSKTVAGKTPLATWLAAKVETATKMISDGEWKAAREAAEAVLKVDAKNDKAKKALEASAKLEQEEIDRAKAPPPAPPKALDDYKSLNDATCIIVFGCFAVGAIVLAFIAVKLGMLHRV